MIYFAIFARLLFLAYLIIVAWQVVVLYKEIVTLIGSLLTNQKPWWCEITKISILTDKIWHGFYYLDWWDFYSSFFIRYLYDEVCKGVQVVSRTCPRTLMWPTMWGVRGGDVFWLHEILVTASPTMVTDFSLCHQNPLNVCFIYQHPKKSPNYIYILRLQHNLLLLHKRSLVTPSTLQKKAATKTAWTACIFKHSRGCVTVSA